MKKVDRESKPGAFVLLKPVTENGVNSKPSKKQKKNAKAQTEVQDETIGDEQLDVGDMGVRLLDRDDGQFKLIISQLF